MIVSARLTDQESINDIERAYQKDSIETANYVVLNLNDFFKIIDMLNSQPEFLWGYGYWCKPAVNAFVEYDKFCGATFAIKKPHEKSNECRVCLEFPYEILRGGD